MSDVTPATKAGAAVTVAEDFAVEPADALCTAARPAPSPHPTPPGPTTDSSPPTSTSARPPPSRCRALRTAAPTAPETSCCRGWPRTATVRWAASSTASPCATASSLRGRPLHDRGDHRLQRRCRRVPAARPGRLRRARPRALPYHRDRGPADRPHLGPSAPNSVGEHRVGHPRRARRVSRQRRRASDPPPAPTAQATTPSPLPTPPAGTPAPRPPSSTPTAHRSTQKALLEHVFLRPRRYHSAVPRGRYTVATTGETKRI